MPEPSPILRQSLQHRGMTLRRDKILAARHHGFGEPPVKRTCVHYDLSEPLKAVTERPVVSAVESYNMCAGAVPVPDLFHVIIERWAATKDHHLDLSLLVRSHLRPTSMDVLSYVLAYLIVARVDAAGIVYASPCLPSRHVKQRHAVLLLGPDDLGIAVNKLLVPPLEGL